MDEQGYFPRGNEPTRAAQVTAVEAEITAQLTRALAEGIDVTHIDSHMGTIFHPPFMPAYIQLAFSHQLPALILRSTPEQMQKMGFDPDTAQTLSKQMDQLEEQGMPLFDSILAMPLDKHEQRLELAQARLDALPPGLHYFIIHPSIDTPELRALAPDWRARVGDYQLFTDKAWQQHVQKSGVQVIGYRALRNILRS
jgi:predicted glycoside hydrolase/deacetylase ChbG (UPF0249 family)